MYAERPRKPRKNASFAEVEQYNEAMAFWKSQQRQQRAQQFGTGEVGGDRTYTAPVHGTTEDGQPVTAAWGREGAGHEGHTFLRDGHAEGFNEFYGSQDAEEHDHYGPRGGTQRGKYTGYGS